MSNLARHLPVPAAAIVLSWVLVGFRVVSGDHLQYLVHAAASVEPGFLDGDWFVETTVPYHFLFRWWATAFFAAGLIEAGMVVWHLVTLAVLGWAVSRWVRAAGGSTIGAVLALAALMVGTQSVWGTVAATGNAALPHFAAVGLTLGAWGAVVARRPRAALGLLVATVYVHVGAGVWAGAAALALAAGDAAHWRARLRSLGVPVAAAGLALVPVAVWVAGLVGSGGADYDALFFGRAPDHYAVSAATTATHLGSILVLAVAWQARRLLPEHRPALTAWWGWVVATFAGGWFFFDVVRWDLFVRSFPYRIFPAVGAVAVAIAAGAATGPDRTSRDRILGAGLVAAFVAGRALPLAGLALVALAVVAARVEARHRVRPARAVLAVVMAAAVFPALATTPHWSLTWPGSEERSWLDGLAAATGPGAVLLAPPHYGSIRLGTGRAVVVDFQAVPLGRGSDLAAWAERMEAITGLDPAAQRGLTSPELAVRYRAAYDARDPADLLAVARRFGATHVFLPRAAGGGPGARVVWEDAGYVVVITGI